MSKEELIEMSGRVDEVLPDSRFRVTLENGHQLIAYSGGKDAQAPYPCACWRQVTVEMSPYDLNKGRVTFRHLPPRAGGAPATQFKRRR